MQPLIKRKRTKEDFPNINWNTIFYEDFKKLYPNVAITSFHNYKQQWQTAKEQVNVINSNIQDNSLSPVQLKIIERITNGEETARAVEKEKISIHQHLCWIDTKSKDYNQQYAEVINKAHTVYRQRLKDDQVSNIKHFTTRSWQASAWLLERMFPAEFAKKEGTKQTNVAVGIKLQVSHKDHDKAEIIS